MHQTDQDTEVDEAVWDAWIKKNQAQDKFRFARRLRVTRYVVVLFLGGLLFWRITS
jgi:hypothetical protein